MNSQQLKLESITTSESQSPLKLVPEVRGLTLIDIEKNKAGDMAEAYASLALMLKGATVFKNTSCVGKTDLCFDYKGSIYKVDVKLASFRVGKGWQTKKASEVMMPVYPLLVIPETGADLSGWYCRWHRKGAGCKPRTHCPPGLENFWEK